MTTRPPATTPEGQLRTENAELRARLEEAEDTLRAIRSGEVEALVVETADGPQIFTLQGLDAESSRFRGEILAQVSDSVIAVDAEGRAIYLNAAAERQYRVRSSDVLGRQLSEIYTRQWPRTETEAGMWAALCEHGKWRGEIIHRTHDGREIAGETSVTALRDAAGAPAGYVRVFRDITEQKLAERRLREQEERQGFALQAAKAAAWDWDIAAGNIVWSPENYVLHDFDPARGAPTYADWESRVHPDDLARTNAMVGDVVEGKAPEFRAEFRVVHRDGRILWLLGLGRVQRDASGAAMRLSGINLDITARKLAEEQMAAMNEQLLISSLRQHELTEAAEMANAAKDRFLAVLSHELRTPLTPALLAAAELENDPALSAEVREDLAMIKRNIELETKLIDDLLDINRVANGKLPLNIEPVDLNEAIRNACGICSPSVRERGIRLETELHAATGLVAADAARLQQVLWNVLKNAIKFTPEKGFIRVTAKRLDGARCEVRMEDSGIGISPEMLPRIFDAFEQGGATVTRQFGGLGLGLAICKALVELHHGTIRAESSGAGKGATFIIELPGAAPLMKATDAVAPVAGAQGSRQLRLLVVEDHADTARVLARLLGRAGFAVVTASDVASALATAERETFDVLISDLGLPDGCGTDVMRGVRARSTVPGIAMSGYGMDEDVRRSHEAGFSEHLVKPVDADKLKEAIRRVTENRGG